MQKYYKKRYKSSKREQLLIILITIIVSTVILLIFHIMQATMSLDKKGLELLNAYEFPTSLVEGGSCMRPYAVGDGVITFGPGITYKDQATGIDDINKITKQNYSLTNNCISLDDLQTVQSIKMKRYENIVNRIAIFNFRTFTQDQFNGLVLLSYNSPNLFNDQQFINVILDPKSTKNEYITAANNYYKQLTNYYDNVNTSIANDGYGQGWYNRIVDSAEVYFDGEYLYQNNARY